MSAVRRTVLCRAVAIVIALLAASPFTAPFQASDLVLFGGAAKSGDDSTSLKAKLTAQAFAAAAERPPDQVQPRFDRPAASAGEEGPPPPRFAILRI